MLLDSTGSPEAAVTAIAADPALVAELRAALPALRAVASAPAGTEGVKAVIGRRTALYPPTYRDEAEAAAWWLDYYDVLADLSLASLEAGMRAYVAQPDSEFMPKPGRLRELAFSAPCRSLTRVHRATLAIRRAETPAEDPKPRADPAEVKALMEEFTAKTSAGAKIPALPSIAGKVDEGGITSEMRALIARLAEEARG